MWTEERRGEYAQGESTAICTRLTSDCFTSQVNNSVDKLDVIINNAALNTTQRSWINGIDSMIFVNHLGPFFFTNLLMEKVLAAASDATPLTTRIVNVSSFAHNTSPMRWSDINFDKKELDVPDDEKTDLSQFPSIMKWGIKDYPTWLTYGQSKTANALFAVELAKRLKNKGIAYG